MPPRSCPSSSIHASCKECDDFFKSNNATLLPSWNSLIALFNTTINVSWRTSLRSESSRWRVLFRVVSRSVQSSLPSGQPSTPFGVASVFQFVYLTTHQNICLDSKVLAATREEKPQSTFQLIPMISSLLDEGHDLISPHRNISGRDICQEPAASNKADTQKRALGLHIPRVTHLRHFLEPHADFCQRQITQQNYPPGPC